MKRQRAPRMVASILAMTVWLAACSGGGGGGGAMPEPVADPPPASSEPQPNTPPTSPTPPPTPPAPSPPPAPPPPASSQAGPSSTLIANEADAVLFLNRTTFGATRSEIDALVGSDAADWLAGEFAKEQTRFLPVLQERFEAAGSIPRFANSHATWNAFIGADDQLRMRTLFALSQILVVADNVNGGANETRRTAYYLDRIGANAFGNYRELLEDVTYAPIMGEYLTYLGNKKGDPRRGSMPDENYAREIMQLFTIGLVRLNPDGSPILDEVGRPVPTYDNDDVMGLARVFTGLRLAGADSRGRNGDPDATFRPMVMAEGDHSTLEKQFLETTIPPNTPGNESIAIALDTLFGHPNVGPFLARQMIQRFSASHPSPDYIARVSAAFDTGQFIAPNGRSFGTGIRGDLEAMVAAIVLDESLFDGAIAPNEGKIREPIIRFTHWARAFDVSAANAANEKDLRNTGRSDRALSQHPVRAPSVFNFYRPGFIAPQTETGAQELTAPELQIASSIAPIGYANFMAEYVLDMTPTENGGPSFVPDYTTEIQLADDPQSLVAHLDTYLTGGRMTAETKNRIVEIVTTISLEEETRADDWRKRAEVAVFSAINSPAFAVAH
ncbi:MAG: DUF1800 family protein [Pseudomonadota bacterium]